MESDPIARKVARILLRSKAVMLRPAAPFRFASGLLSPIYCDNRILISLPRQRRSITRCFVGLVRSVAIPVDVVAGTATAGIPHAAWLAAELRLPMVYVRAQGKGHGKDQLVEGLLSAGQRAVVIEDLVTTGGSCLGSVTALRQAGAIVEHVVAIFTYAFPSTAAVFAQAGVQLHALTTLSALLDVAVTEHYLAMADQALVTEWAGDPMGWSNMREQTTP